MSLDKWTEEEEEEEEEEWVGERDRGRFRDRIAKWERTKPLFPCFSFSIFSCGEADISSRGKLCSSFFLQLREVLKSSSRTTNQYLRNSAKFSRNPHKSPENHIPHITIRLGPVRTMLGGGNF